MITTRMLRSGAKRDVFFKHFCLILCVITSFGSPSFAQSTPTPTPIPTPNECLGSCAQDVCMRFAPPTNGTGNCVSLSEPCERCSCDSTGADQVICEPVSIIRYVSSAGECLPDSFDTFACHLAPTPTPSPSPVKFVPSDGSGGDEFGAAVAMSGVTAIVGARHDDDQGTSSGSAYIFDTRNGTQARKLTASDGFANINFGRSVALDGTTAVVGAPQDGYGSAYIFDTSTGTESAKLTASDGAASDRFGWSVAVSGATIIVGAYFDDDRGLESGSAYIFETTNGTQLYKLTASDGAANDNFGFAVAVSGTTAVVGSYKDDRDTKTFDSGSVYMFDTNTGAQLFKYTSSDGAGFDQFGRSVALSGTTMVVGADQDGDRGDKSGSAYIFDTETRAQLFKLTASDGADDDLFGGSVAVSSVFVVVGASYDNARAYRSGSAYIFDTSTGAQLFKLTASDGVRADYFGRSVAVSSDMVLVGADSDDDQGDDSGSIYAFNATTGKAADLKQNF